MTDFSSTSLPPPKNWQDFERNCRILFEQFLKDPAVQTHGRPGQRQNGVDIFGRESGGARWVGIQCKGKDRGYGGKVTEKELKEEVKKAFKFKPRLSWFILATTAPDDVKIQETARVITQENKESGNRMTVSVWGWDTIVQTINSYPEALKAFHPDLTPFTDIILSDVHFTKIVTTGMATGISRVETMLQDVLKSVQAAGDDSNKDREAVDQLLHGNIDDYRDMITTGHPQTALTLLEKLKARYWDTASSRVKFRITTNIGAAKLNLGNQKDAAEDFLEAIQYDPTDTIGMANVVLARMIKEDKTGAIQAAKEALDQNPMNEGAASHFIRLHFDDSTVTNPFDLLPQSLHMANAVRMAAISFYRHREDPRWHEIALKAHADFPESDEFRRAAAEVDLDNILASEWFLMGEESKVGDAVGRLQASADTLQLIWSTFVGSELPLLDTSLPHNLVLAYRALGEYGSAKKVLDEALSRKPDANDLDGLRANICMALRDEEGALDALKKTGDGEPATLLMAAELRLARDPISSRALLLKAEGSTSLDSKYRIHVSCLIIKSYVNEGKTDVALIRSRKLVELFPDEIEPLVILHDIQLCRGENGSEETLEKARKILKETSPFYDRFIVANAFNEVGKFDAAVDVLASRIDYTRDTPALQLLLSAMINSDRRTQAHEAISNLPRKIAEKPYYLRVQAAVHMNRGDYPSCLRLVERYLKIFPVDLSMRLKWIDVLIRLGEGNTIKAFLETDAEHMEGIPSERMRLAILLNHYGFGERGLRLGYEVFLKHRRDAQVHLQYVALLLSPGMRNDIDLNVTRIDKNTVFSIENEKGERDTYHIETDEPLCLDEKYVLPDHPLAIKAIGLKVNDVIVIQDDKQPIETWRVISIKHKYIHALHETMEGYERDFPTVGGLERCVVSGTDRDALEPILSRVRKRQQAIEEAFAIYEQSQPLPLPLESLTYSFGGNVIEVWQSLVSTGRRFRVCRGTAEEREFAKRAIADNGGHGCVVDLLTCYIIRRLGIEDAVSAVCGRTGIAQTSVDALRFYREEIKSYLGTSFMTIHWHGGQYYREEYSDDRLQVALKELDSDLSWIENCCDIIPAEGTQDLPSGLRGITKKIKRTFFDTILAASGQKRLLLCEDITYRTIGAEQAGLHVSWLQPVIMLAAEQNLMSMTRYYETIINMIEFGISWTSINADVLLSVAGIENDRAKRRFAIAAETLGSPDTDVSSAVGVIAEFANRIWSLGYPSLICKAQTGKLLSCLLEGRKYLSQGIASLLYLRTSRNRYFGGYLEGWLRGHFLLY